MSKMESNDDETKIVSHLAFCFRFNLGGPSSIFSGVKLLTGEANLEQTSSAL